MKKLRVFEGFAGYGGASFALKRLHDTDGRFEFDVVGYSEFDKYADIIYRANHGGTNYGDFSKVDPADLPDFDLFTGGFPCQPFSSNGMRLGTEDPYGRGAMLGHIIRILRVKKPRYVLLENVKGFLSSKFKPVRDQLLDDLVDIGYGTGPDNALAVALLNSKDYGVPQNRERVWMFARLGGLPDGLDIRPKEARNDLRVKDVLDFEPDEKLYLNERRVAHLKEKHGFKSLAVDQPYCIDLYNKKIKYDGFCVTLTQPEHNGMRLVEPPRGGKEIVRKFSATELFRLMGFRITRDNSVSEIDFAGLSYSQLAKRAGNGWDVNVVERLLRKLVYNGIIEI